MTTPPPEPPVGPADNASPPPPPPPAPPGSMGGGGAAAIPQQNQKAMWSMIAGIASLVCCGIGIVAGVVAIVLSTQGKREIEISGGQQSGAGMAQAGLILGIIGIVLGAGSIPFYLGRF